MLVGDIIANPIFLKEGNFFKLPGSLEVPEVLYKAGNGVQNSELLPIKDHAIDVLQKVGNSMPFLWNFLYERSIGNFEKNPEVNINTRRRYIYNTYGIRRILQNLKDNKAENAKVLLVTAYETPIQELLDSSRIKEVHVVDISKAGLDVVNKKYANHKNAEKLILECRDFSCIDPFFHQREIINLSDVLDESGLASYYLTDHFTSLSSGAYCIPLPYRSQLFDAIHLPFVLGSMHLTSLTAVIEKFSKAFKNNERIDYQDFIGQHVLESKSAQSSSATVTNHILNEIKRILKPNGNIVINLWARPISGKEGMVKLSDVILPKADLNILFNDYKILFSGNPQPSLPKTVGHILEFNKV